MAGAAVTVVPVVPTMLPKAEAATTTASYVAVQPCRLADTREGTPRLDSQTIQITARGTCGVPSTATSVALTLTVVQPPSAGYLTAWPAAQTRPMVSNVNFDAGQVRANGSITRLDGNGRFKVFTSVAADVVVDVVGAFVPSNATTSGRFVPRTPARLFDSRSGARLAAGGTVTVPLPSGVPSDSVALALNVTLTDSGTAGFVSAYPAGRAMTTASILNVDAVNETRAAAGIFPVSAGGITFYVSAGGHLIVDVVGYFTGASAPSSTDGLFTAVDPARLLDTRGTSPLGDGVPLYPGGAMELATSRGGSIAFNVTAVQGPAGYDTAYPAGTERPGTSTVNSTGPADTVANFSITQMSDRGLGLYSQSGTHLLVDVQGWFTGPSAVATLPPPGNTAPPAPQPTFGACTHQGLDSLNATRAQAGVAPLTVNAGAESYACSWALQLAQRNNGLTHSPTDARDAGAGCASGENIAMSSGTSWEKLYSMWYNSPAHMSNVKNSMYKSVGIAFVIRTEPSGAQSIWGVTDFAVC